ncbi:ARID DNA-binding domain-containing protein [Tanacetum coccineum]
MSNPSSYSNKWPRINRSTYGLPNSWYQSKTWGHLRRNQHRDFIQRKIKRERQDHLGACIKQISERCKDMLKKELQGIMVYNKTLNQPQLTNMEQDKYKNYKCFQCKQLGHIIKFCPMDDKDEDINVKTDTRNLARGRMEGFKTTKPSIMLKYPESIHFSTTCMIKGTDLANWDDIWYVSNRIDRHVCYKLDFFCNIKEDFLVKELENQRKLLFTYGIEDGGQGWLVPGVHYAPEVTLNILSIDLIEKQGFEVKYDGNRCTLSCMFNNKEIQFFDEDKMRTMQNKYIEDYFESLAKKNEGIKEDLIKIKGNLYSTKRSIPGPIPPTINGIQIHLFDLYKLIEGLGGYLSVHFCQEFDTIGEILGLSKRNGEEVKECYLKYLDVFVSYFKTARAPEQGYKNTLVESAWKAEKDRDCLGTHQWDL